jgi:hypothetical protein
VGRRGLADRIYKLSGVEPLAEPTDLLARLVPGWPANRIDDLLPWAYVS